LLDLVSEEKRKEILPATFVSSLDFVGSTGLPVYWLGKHFISSNVVGKKIPDAMELFIRLNASKSCCKIATHHIFTRTDHIASGSLTSIPNRRPPYFYNTFSQSIDNFTLKIPN
jgi:hypothetical protein